MTRLHIPVAVRWSDLDAYQHVNNVEMFRLLEEARITAFWRHPGGPAHAGADGAQPEPGAPGTWPTAILDAGPGASTHTFVARQEIEYLRPLAFDRVPVRIEMWLGALGGASIEICYEVHDGDASIAAIGPAAGASPYARASTTIVLVDAASGSPRRITPDEREIWQEFTEDPIVFRRR